jgi:hypothetical protein
MKEFFMRQASSMLIDSISAMSPDEFRGMVLNRSLAESYRGIIGQYRFMLKGILSSCAFEPKDIGVVVATVRNNIPVTHAHILTTNNKWAESQVRRLLEIAKEEADKA